MDCPTCASLLSEMDCRIRVCAEFNDLLIAADELNDSSGYETLRVAASDARLDARISQLEFDDHQRTHGNVSAN
jgi:hypothetical protein